MITKTCVLLLTTLVAGCATPPVIDSSNQAVIEAQYLGRALYEDITTDDGAAPYTSREADLIKMIKEKGMDCEGTYKAVSTIDQGRGIENLFLVLYPDTEGVQFGRHFRFQFKAGTNDLIDVTPSTNTCLLVPASGDAIPFATHLLSDVPNEFHVFLSLLHNKELYVSTKKGLWNIKNGEIRPVEK